MCCSTLPLLPPPQRGSFYYIEVQMTPQILRSNSDTILTVSLIINYPIWVLVKKAQPGSNDYPRPVRNGFDGFLDLSSYSGARNATIEYPFRYGGLICSCAHVS